MKVRTYKQKIVMMKAIKICTLFLLAQVSTAVLAQEQVSQDSLLDMGLEELMNIKITSVSKQSERLQDVASSIYVISQEDIRRSGATRLQDLLQMVPGTFFNFNNYNAGEFGLRENASSYLGSVLVLVDNVPYQSPYNSAFDFADFDIDFEEIERIEVIKGPGGTIYGANAATGVINIFSKKAPESQGWRVTHNQGTRGFLAPSIRYGATINENTHLKLYGKGKFFNGFRPLDELDGHYVTVPTTDVDTNTGAGLGTSSGTATIENNYNDDVYRTNKITLGGEFSSQLKPDLLLTSHFFYNNHKNDYYYPIYASASFQLINSNFSRYVSSVRLDKNFSEDHTLFGQLSINKGVYNLSRGGRMTSVLNFEIQDNLRAGINNLSFGVTARSVDFRLEPTSSQLGVNWIRNSASEYLLGAFIQNKFKFSYNFDFTIGVKAETWTLVDRKPEWSPSARFSYRPTTNITIWGSGSRSVTTPGYITTDIELTLINPMPPVLPLRVAVINEANIDQSEYWTGEFGVKASAGSFSLDFSAYYVNSSKLVSPASVSPVPVQSPTNPGELILPVYYSNILQAKNYGTETVVKWLPSSAVRFELSHAMFVSEVKGMTDPSTGQPYQYSKPEALATPKHITRFRSYFTIAKDFEFSINGIYYTEAGTGRFFYDQQRYSTGAIPNDKGLLVTESGGKFRADFKLAKYFNDRKNSIFIWGTDVFNTGTVLGYNPLISGIPMQVHALFGAGASLTID